ncbi:MAG: hypothetical protein ACO2O4_02325 [Minisyncoccia bacterium]|jgi:hypothetical protein
MSEKFLFFINKNSVFENFNWLFVVKSKIKSDYFAVIFAVIKNKFRNFI